MNLVFFLALLYYTCTKILQSCATLCEPMDCSPPGSSVQGDSPDKYIRVDHHGLLQGIFLTQGLNLHLIHLLNRQPGSLFSSASTTQRRKWQPTPVDLLQNGLVGSPCSPRDPQESSPTPQFKSISSSALSLLHSPTLTSIHDYWKNHSLD